MWKWVESLSISEKRYVKLLGKLRSGKSESQQLALFDWLNRASPEDEIPTDSGFAANMAVVTARLKDLILDSLHLLHKQKDIDFILRNELNEIALLLDKKLVSPALRRLKQCKKKAAECCRYPVALICIHHEQHLLRTSGESEITEKLKELREEESEVLKSINDLQEIRFRHDMVRALARQIFAPRDSALLEEVKQYADHPVVHSLARQGRYAERILAVNILGLYYLLAREPARAVQQYRELLTEWRQHPDWQADEAPLLLQVCRIYQNACYYTTLTQEELRESLSLVPDFSALSPEVARDYQRMLYSNQLTQALNTGNFDALHQLLPAIDAWLRREEENLPVAQRISLCNNLAVAEFLSGNFSASNRYVIRILNMPDKKAREDIRDFARVLQAVLQFEMGNTSLNEYLTRSGKRHFSKQGYKLQFEQAVFRYIEEAMEVADPADLRPVTSSFLETLESMAASQPQGVPLLGLMEMCLWARSRHTGTTLKEVFLETVRENLKQMNMEGKG